MDRAVLEGDPHSIVEAMALCGYAIGASVGVVYIRAEYPLAIKRLKKAIDDAHA
jgi:NADH:ubiquinone oxidoreductase subunit F (NADH-binding)